MNPVDPRFESPVDRAIREAAERGEFDDLPGKGRPLPGAGTIGPVDENWWVRGYLEREGLSGEALLPPSIQLRKELDRIDATVARFPDERLVREHVDEVNSRVVEHIRNPVGPRVPIRKLDADEVVGRWRAARERLRSAAPGASPPGSRAFSRGSAAASQAPDVASPGPRQRARRSWWARLRRRR